MQVLMTAPLPLSPQVLMAAALLGAEASTASTQSWGGAGVGALLLRFLEYFSGTSRDALHAVVVDSESRLQAKQLSRLQLLSEHRAVVSTSSSAVLSTPPTVHDDEPSQERAHHGASQGRGGASHGRSAHHSAASRGPYEEAVYAASLLVQDPMSGQFVNVSDSAFRWGHVQAVFRDALERLQRAVRLLLRRRLGRHRRRRRRLCFLGRREFCA